MMLGRVLRRPAAAEVRHMLAQIKKDNMERGRVIAASKATKDKVTDLDVERGQSRPKKPLYHQRRDSIVARNIQE